jgi:hypothetical protein
MVTTYKRLYVFAVRKRFAIVSMTLGFSLNFGLPFKPTIKSDNKAYTYLTSS